MERISISKNITAEPVWSNPERLKWWIDLLFMADEEGNVEVSFSELAKRWKSTRFTVRRFFDTLERKNITRTQTAHKPHINRTSTAHIIICGIGIYKEARTLSAQEPHTNRTSPAQVKEAVEEKTEEPKSVIKDNPKKKYAESVTMTETEYGKLVSDYGEKAAKEMVNILNNYKLSKGVSYKSDYRAILSWVVGEYKKRKGGSRNDNPWTNYDGKENYEQF